MMMGAILSVGRVAITRPSSAIPSAEFIEQIGAHIVALQKNLASGHICISPHHFYFIFIFCFGSSAPWMHTGQHLWLLGIIFYWVSVLCFFSFQLFVFVVCLVLRPRGCTHGLFRSSRSRGSIRCRCRLDQIHWHGWLICTAD